jgi:hypothetical protein
MSANIKTLKHGLLLIGIVAVGIVSIIGSGGGGGSSFGRGASSVPALPITSDNAFDVASAVVQAVLLGFDTGEVGGGPLEPGPQQTQVGIVGDTDRPMTLAVEVTRTRAGMLALEVAVGPVTEPCDSGGTVRISGDLANPPNLTVGDTLTLRFSNCDDGDGNVINGRLDIVIRDIVGDPLTDIYRLTLDAKFTDVTVADATDSYEVSGDATVTEDTLALPIVLLVLSGERLEFGSQDEVLTLFDFSQSLEVDTGIIPDRKVADAFGTLASKLLGGRVDYETALSIEASGDADPDTGEVPITGAENSMVTIVILDGTAVRLDVDSDGDGIIDDMQFTTWAALSGEAGVNVQ